MRRQTISDGNDKKQKRPKLTRSTEDESLGLSETKIKKQFPELHREMFVKDKSLTLRIDEINSLDELDEKSVEGASLNEVGEVSRSRISDPLDRYSPSAEDFLARSDTDEDALAIINYLKRKKEISVEKARELTESIPEEDDEVISYYGDDYGNYVLEGSSDINEVDVILSWLKKLH